jgi:hypothetical protein
MGQGIGLTTFNKEFLAAKPGQAIVYYTGWYAKHATAGVYARVRELHDEGHVLLVQRRVPNSTSFEYLAVKRRKQVVPRLRFSQPWGNDFKTLKKEEN